MGHGDFPLGKEAESNATRQIIWTLQGKGSDCGTPPSLQPLPSVGFEKTRYRDNMEDGAVGKWLLACFYVEEILSQTFMGFTRTKYFPIMFHVSDFFFNPLQIKVGQMFS